MAGASATVLGYGTVLKLGDGATPTEAFATIAEVRDVGGPGMSRGTVDVTNQTSPGGWIEKIASLKDGGDVTFDIGFIPGSASHGAAAGGLQEWFDKGDRRNLKVVFTQFTVPIAWILPCICTGFSPNGPVQDALTASITLAVAGKPTFTGVTA